MAILRCDLRSDALQMDTSLLAILPQDRAKTTERPKVLYLLHGLWENCTAWTCHTRIFDLAVKYNVIVIMPEVQRSFYTDMKHGPSYYTYVADELPRLCGEMFGISAKREDTYVAGLSMGGYGALKLGLSRPAQYAGCAGFSSCADIRAVRGFDDPIINKDIAGILGEDKVIPDKEDLFLLAQRVADGAAPIPKMMVTCGLGDYMYDQNVRFKEHLERLRLPFTYHEWEGIHNWKFWSASLELLFPFFFESASEVEE